MNYKTCYIVGAGDNTGTNFIKEENDYVIAVDGGYEIIKKMGITPDYTMGDFDSLGYVPDEENLEVHIVEKDDTDTMLAVRHAISLGIDKIVIFGGTGGRADHTIGNIQTMIYAANHNCDIEMRDSVRTYKVIKNKKVSLRARDKGDLSVFALAGNAEGVSITGAKYTLENGTLTCDNPTAISNSFIGNNVEIQVDKGTILVIYDN